MATKPFKKTIVTPVGVAIYPHLNQPDVKFGEPTYRCNLRLEGEDATAFIAKLEEFKAEAKEHLGATKDLVLPIADAVDQDKNPIPGAIDVKCKTRAFFKTADGSLVENKISIVDSNKEAMDKSVAIWGGSKVRLALQIGAVSTAIYSGLLCRIQAVQVLELVSGNSSPTDMFDKEDGYKAEKKEPALEEDDIDF